MPKAKADGRLFPPPPSAFAGGPLQEKAAPAVGAGGLPRIFAPPGGPVTAASGTPMRPPPSGERSPAYFRPPQNAARRGEARQIARQIVGIPACLPTAVSRGGRGSSGGRPCRAAFAPISPSPHHFPAALPPPDKSGGIYGSHRLYPPLRHHGKPGRPSLQIRRPPRLDLRGPGGWGTGGGGAAFRGYAGPPWARWGRSAPPCIR